MLITALAFALQITAVAPPAVIRVNQLGYLPDAPKVAVLCTLQSLSDVRSFVVTNARSAKVYHDDVGDYSTNEPIMDGTANLSYLLAAMSR